MRVRVLTNSGIPVYNEAFACPGLRGKPAGSIADPLNQSLVDLVARLSASARFSVQYVHYVHYVHHMSEQATPKASSSASMQKGLNLLQFLSLLGAAGLVASLLLHFYR